MKDSVELCQREGRARQVNCAFVVMEERPDRPISALRKVQRVQEGVIQTFEPSMVEGSRQEEFDRQLNREANARNVLDGANSMQTLNIYRQKTKGHLDESHSECKVHRTHTIKLQYYSVRFSVVAECTGPSKKLVKQAAAKMLVEKIKAFVN
jgi:hypothetical protein